MRSMYDVFRHLKIILLISAFCAVFSAPELSAQEIFVRKDSFSTEVFLRIAPEAISLVDRDGNSAVVVSFVQPMKAPFSQKVDDEFVDSVEGSGTRLRVVFKPTADFAVFNDVQGLKFIATRARELDEVLLSYGIAAPMLKKEDLSTDDPVIEAQLRQAEAYIKNRQFNSAANIYNVIIATTKSAYYKPEATYHLGKLYMQMGEYDPAYYYDAVSIFDGFIFDYPDNNRILQVKNLTAEAKRKGNMMTDAADAYKEVYEDAQDAETRRLALEEMAGIYVQIGQFDNAIAAYEEYLKNFQEGADRVRAEVGKLYVTQGYTDKAYDLFAQVPVNVLMERTTSDEALKLAKIFDSKGDSDKAEQIYTKLTEGNYLETQEAMSLLAQLYKNKGDMDSYTAALNAIAEKDPYSELGKEALVEYAEVHYAEKSADDWKLFLAPVYDTEDLFDLLPRSEIVQIKAMYKDGDTFRLVAKINDYLRDYPDSEHNSWLLVVKEEVLYDKAVEYQQNKNYYPALDIYNQLLSEFPESVRVPAMRQAVDDIYYDMAKELFEGGKYAESTKAVEARMIQQPGLSSRWELLWEDSVYNYIINNVGAVSPQKIRFKSREYLTNMPKGRYVNEIRGVLEQNFTDPYNAAAEAGDSAQVIKLYEENRSWLESWHNQAYANVAKLNVTKALMDLELRRQAVEMFRSMTPMMMSRYAELGYGLCQKDVIYDINRLNQADFLKVVGEAERCRELDYTMDLIGKYTADKKTALKAQYDLAKNISDDRKREAVLNNTYEQLLESQDNRFDGYEEVYLDMGLLSYRKNDYAGALIPLQNYADIAPNTSEKKAEALYYIGKSLLAMNERERGFDYFRRVVALPPSIYRNMAQSELEDDAWRNNMNRN